MELGQILSWVVGVVGLIGFVFVGKKEWWAWYINLACQILWATYALVTGQPAFLATAAVYFVIFAINAYKWTKDHLVAKKIWASEPGTVMKFGKNTTITRLPDEPKEESNLVKHARVELERIGEEPAVIDWYLRVIREYASFGHSGGSAWATTQVLEELLSFKPLSPLTNDWTEWLHHGPAIAGGENGLWQNKRDGRAFSYDGGETYHLVDDPEQTIHTTACNICSGPTRRDTVGLKCLGCGRDYSEDAYVPAK